MFEKRALKPFIAYSEVYRTESTGIFFETMR